MPLPAERPVPSASLIPSEGSGTPPEEVHAGPLVLRRMDEDDADAVAAAVGASLDHLRPWMAWATPESADNRVARARIVEANDMWDCGIDHVYAIIVAEEKLLVGTIGLHRRAADGGAEIGYWIAADQVRRGYGTAAAGALTHVAASLPGVRRVEIHCDVANTASAGIPRKLGYRLDRVDEHEPEAPGERGRRMIWVWEPPE